MKCPKCGYISFKSAKKCDSCKFDLKKIASRKAVTQHAPETFTIFVSQGVSEGGAPGIEEGIELDVAESADEAATLTSQLESDEIQLNLSGNPIRNDFDLDFTGVVGDAQAGILDTEPEEPPFDMETPASSQQETLLETDASPNLEFEVDGVTVDSGDANDVQADAGETGVADEMDISILADNDSRDDFELGLGGGETVAATDLPPIEDPEQGVDKEGDPALELKPDSAPEAPEMETAAEPETAELAEEVQPVLELESETASEAPEAEIETAPENVATEEEVQPVLELESAAALETPDVEPETPTAESEVEEEVGQPILELEKESASEASEPEMVTAPEEVSELNDAVEPAVDVDVEPVLDSPPPETGRAPELPRQETEEPDFEFEPDSDQEPPRVESVASPQTMAEEEEAGYDLDLELESEPETSEPEMDMGPENLMANELPAASQADGKGEMRPEFKRDEEPHFEGSIQDTRDETVSETVFVEMADTSAEANLEKEDFELDLDLEEIPEEQEEEEDLGLIIDDLGLSLPVPEIDEESRTYTPKELSKDQ